MAKPNNSTDAYRTQNCVVWSTMERHALAREFVELDKRAQQSATQTSARMYRRQRNAVYQIGCYRFDWNRD